MEMLTSEFRNAVRENDVLMVRIMLKDSLLVDPSFNQFNYMVDYAQDNGLKIWMSDEEDDSFEMDKNEDLNLLLVQLVNCFSIKRVNYIKGLILQKFSSTNKNNTQSQTNAQNQFNKNSSKHEKSINWNDKSIPNMPIKPPKQFWYSWRNSKAQIKEIMADISRKHIATTRDLLRLRDAAKEIVDTCDKLLGK